MFPINPILSVKNQCGKIPTYRLSEIKISSSRRCKFIQITSLEGMVSEDREIIYLKMYTQ